MKILIQSLIHENSRAWKARNYAEGIIFGHQPAAVQQKAEWLLIYIEEGIVKMKKYRRIRSMIFILIAAGMVLAGCNKEQKTSVSTYVATEEDLRYALPKIGEAEIIKAEVKAGSRGTILVATVGSPNTEILQEAARILEEKGYLLKIEVCEDYLMPNQLVTEGKADCNFYQHEAFLKRYNIEKQTNLLEMAKIHYEPMAIFSEKVEDLETMGKGAKVAVPDNPTALAKALWLLQAEGLLSLMSDADMNTVIGDIANNPLELEIVTMKEEEILKDLSGVDLALCHKGYALKEGIVPESIMLAEEKKDSMMAQELSHSVVASEYPNENASILTEVLVSEEMQKFVETKYQGSIYMMDGMLSDVEVTVKEMSETSEAVAEEGTEETQG